MKQFSILIALLALCSVFYAQTEDWLWTQQAGGTSYDFGQAIATDSCGNSFVTGNFFGTVTFGTTTLTTNGGYDIFIAKLDTNGNYLWVQQSSGTGSEYGYGIDIDSSGNSYITGYFTGNAIFGSNIFNSGGSNDIFIAKLDSVGNYLWAQQAGGTSDNKSVGIATDGSGNSYITGYSYGNASFGSTTLINSGVCDIFIAKLDTNGNYLWAKKAGGTSYDNGYGIATDISGNSYVTGSFEGTATFGSITLTSSGGSDIFIASLDTSGNYLWAQKAGVSSNESGYGIATDGSGNSYVTGCFAGTATFGSSTLTSSGGSDIFIAKLDPVGNYLWARRGGGIGDDNGYGIATDVNDNCYVTGYFQGIATFGSRTLTSSGNSEIFIIKLDSVGNYLGAKKAGGTSAEQGNGIAADSSGNSYVTGYFNGTATFGGSSFSSSGNSDIFIAKKSSAPVLIINEAIIDFATAYLGYNSTHNLWLRNLGGDTLSVDSLFFKLTDSLFEVTGLTLPLEIAYGDSAAIQIRFTPLVGGAVTDSLIIYNNSINLPRVAIRLSGTGQYVPPKPPENVDVVMDGGNAVISWDAVTETVMHTPIEPDYYLVFYNGSSDPETGLYYYLGRSWTLSHIHDGVGLHAQHMFYRVRAYKYYGRSSFDLSSLVPGMSEAEVMWQLRIEN